MSAHPKPWHRDSIYGNGPRAPLDREQRARFRYLLTAHRRGRRLTPHAELVGNALVKRLSIEGQCDPAHDTIANDVGCCARTVRRALAALKVVGLVAWQQRIVRAGWRVAQTSNAYLLVPAVGTLASSPAKRSGGQRVRETLKIDIPTVLQVASVADPKALAARVAAVQASLLAAHTAKRR